MCECVSVFGGGVNAQGEDERTERGGRRVLRRDQRWQSSKSSRTKTANETGRHDGALMGGMTLSKILQISFLFFLIASNLLSRRVCSAKQAKSLSALLGGPAFTVLSFILE